MIVEQRRPWFDQLKLNNTLTMIARDFEMRKNLKQITVELIHYVIRFMQIHPILPHQRYTPTKGTVQ